MTAAHHHTRGHDRHGIYPTEILDLDAEVNGRYLDESFALIEDALGATPRRIVDLGAGTGTGAVALARHFADAQILAVDASAEMLERTRMAACRAEVDDNVQTVLADIDHDWPMIEPVDLIWAASSIHHVADPATVFGAAFGDLRPGGVIAVVEMDDQPTFLPATDGLAALEQRLHDSMGWRTDHDWAAAIRTAGFDEVRVHALVTDLNPAPARAADYAQAFLTRVNDSVRHNDSILSREDSVALDAVVRTLAERRDLHFHSTRTLWLARRPRLTQEHP